jgi:hypothetical protein
VKGQGVYFMSVLVRGIIISIILLGISVLLLFPDLTLNKVVAPIIDSVIGKTEGKDDGEQDRAAVKPQLIIREPIIELTPVITTSKETLDTQIQAKQTIKIDSLQSPPSNLSGSDIQVMALVNDINPKFKVWIAPKEQIRKWVALIDRLALGEMPTKYRPLTSKITGFNVITKDGRLYVNPENHKRFNSLIDVITTVRPDLLASYYRYWLPIFDTAYDELGNSSRFNKRLRLSIDSILAVNPLEIEQAELKKPTSIIYKYMNADIEDNSDITKWVWRIGPENAKKLQNYLREFIRQLDS